MYQPVYGDFILFLWESINIKKCTILVNCTLWILIFDTCFALYKAGSHDSFKHLCFLLAFLQCVFILTKTTLFCAKLLIQLINLEFNNCFLRFLKATAESVWCTEICGNIPIISILMSWKKKQKNVFVLWSFIYFYVTCWIRSNRILWILDSDHLYEILKSSLIKMKSLVVLGNFFLKLNDS